MDKRVRFTLNSYAKNGLTLKKLWSKAIWIQYREEVLKFPDLILLKDSVSEFCERTYLILNLSRVHEGVDLADNINSNSSNNNNNRRSRNNSSNNNDDETNNE
jgi:hypothetical protein